MTFQNVANQVLFCYQWGRLTINNNTEFVVVRLTYFASSDKGIYAGKQSINKLFLLPEIFNEFLRKIVYGMKITLAAQNPK